ncbi:MAG: PepSY-like domain-containing protein [Bacteroidales bacterium]|nr:PepSY-like domain-containing protein [Bacteroidales bacterium]
MKNLLLSLCMVALSLMAFAQVTPPKQVTDAFAGKFADAQKVEWEQEIATEWEADFMLAGVEKTACFSAKGEWMETETAMCRKELPAEVFKTLAIVFDGFEMEELESIEKPGFTGYEIALEKGGTNVEIQAAPDGTFTLLSIMVKEDHQGKCCKADDEGDDIKCAGKDKDDDEEDED